MKLKNYLALLGFQESIKEILKTAPFKDNRITKQYVVSLYNLKTITFLLCKIIDRNEIRNRQDTLEKIIVENNFNVQKKKHRKKIISAMNEEFTSVKFLSESKELTPSNDDELPLCSESSFFDDVDEFYEENKEPLLGLAGLVALSAVGITAYKYCNTENNEQDVEAQ